MPGISHLAFGLILVIPFMLFAKEKFNYKVAAIFILNNWVGPDSYWAWKFIPFEMHALLGFMLWAIPLALFYSYLSRFSFGWSGRFFTVVDDGKREVNLRNSYILCVAGGTLHLLLDSLFHGGSTGFHIFPSEMQTFFQDTFGITLVNPNLADINSWFTATYGFPDVLILFGFLSMLTVALLMLYFIRRELKVVLIFLFTLVAFILLSQILLGWNTFHENEFAATFYTFFFIFLPLIAFAYVMNDVNKNPREPSEPRVSGTTLLRFMAILTLIIGAGFFIVGLSPFLAPSLMAGLFVDWFTLGDLLIIGPVVMVIAGLGVVSGVGLLLKNNYCRYYAMFLAVLLWFFVFPLAIALALSRSDVKELFEKKSE